MNTFCALNIFDENNILINKNGRPLMFIWNGIDSLKEALNSDDLQFFLNKNGCFRHPEKYTGFTIKSFTYSNDNSSEERYNDVDLNIQDIFELKDYKETQYKFLYQLTFILYKKVFPKENEGIDGDAKDEQLVVLMYEKIKRKYKTKLSKDTFIMAISSEIQSNPKFTKLSENNKQILIDTLKDLLDGRE